MLERGEKGGGPFVRCFAPAKVNIFLRVLGRRANGYHDLESFMVPLSLGDTLTLSVEKDQKEKIAFAITGADLPVDQNNLVVRAVSLFEDCYGKSLPPLSLLLEKRIPVAAGLGGGSSDAAATLLGLNALVPDPVSLKVLQEKSVALGADVPFFMLQKPALAHGIGEILEPVATKERYWFVIINPGFAVSTAWVYQNLEISLTSGIDSEKMRAQESLAHQPWQRFLVNDLEQVTLRVHPVLREIKNLLIEKGADGALMSGSGPTLFGIYSGQQAEQAAKQSYQSLKVNKNWKVFLAHNME